MERKDTREEIGTEWRSSVFNITLCLVLWAGVRLTLAMTKHSCKYKKVCRKRPALDVSLSAQSNT